MPTPTLGRLLIVDDEVELMTVLGNMLRKQGYETTGFASGNEALEALREREFDLLLADLMMPEMSGITLLKAGLEIDPHLTGIIMTGQGTVQTAVEAMKGGAFDYLLKPFKLNAVLPVLARAMDFRRLRLDNVQLRDTLAFYELGKAVAFTLDTNTILHKVADAALQQCEADEVSVMLPTGENDGLYVAVVRGEQRERLLGERLPMEHGIAGWVARHHEALILNGEVIDPRFAPVHPRPDIHSAVSMPMLAGNKLAGILNVNCIHHPRPLTLGQIKALTILVSIAAPALEAARLYEQVRHSEESYRLVLENVDEVVYVTGETRDDPLSGSVLFVSGRVESILGYKPEEFIRDSRLWRSILHPDDLPTVAEATRTIYANQQGAIREYRVKHKVTGEYRWMEDRVVPKLDEADRMIGIFGVARDITERKRAEEALTLFRTLIDRSNDAIEVIDPETARFLDVNEKACMDLDYTRQEFSSLTVFDIDPTIDRSSYGIGLERLRNFGPLLQEGFHQRKDGSTFPVEVSLRYVQLDRGYVVSVARDITERKQAEETLRKLSSAVEQTADMVFICDRDGIIEYVNPAFENLTGYTKEEALGQTPEILKSGKHVPRFFEKLWETILAGDVFQAVIINRKKNGELYYEEKTITPLKDERGSVTHFVSTGKDITERMQAEAALEESQHRLQALFDNTQDAILLADDEARYVDANPAACALLGYSREELLRMTVWDVTPLPNRELGQELWRAFIAAGKQDGEYTLHRKDGTTVEADYRAVANIVPGLHLSVIRDVTERKQREREREVIITMASALRSARTRADILSVVVDQLLDLLQAEGAALATQDPFSGDTVFEVARGEFARGAYTRLPLGEGVGGQVISTGQAYLNNDIRSEPRFARPDLLGDMRALACVPLIVQGRAIGALLVGRKTQIASDDVRLLNAIADITANAIHRATLHEQTERSVQRLTALHTIDTTITASFDLRLTLNVLLDQVTTHLGVDAADILLLNAPTQTLEYAAGHGFRTNAIARARLRLNEGHAGRAVLERCMVHIPNLPESGPAFVRAQLLAGENFIAYSGAPLIAKGQIKGVLEIFHREPIHPDPEWLEFLETLAGQAAIAIDNAQLFDNLQRSNVDLALAYDATIEGWSRALDLRDKETEGHTQRVTELTLRLAREMGIDDAELVHIRRGALLHDIGKMGIPDTILLKPGPLTEEEWVVMKKHPAFAFDMLSPIAYLQRALDIPYCHHEKWDGAGYPRGLKDEGIPLAARIFAVVDVYDALRSDRPYRPGWSEEKVREYIREQAGQHFDPQVVELFLTITATEETRGSTPS